MPSKLIMFYFKMLNRKPTLSRVIDQIANCSVVSTQTLFLPGSRKLGKLLALSSFSILLTCKMGMDDNSTFLTGLVPGFTETKARAQRLL